MSNTTTAAAPAVVTTPAVVAPKPTPAKGKAAKAAAPAATSALVTFEPGIHKVKVSDIDAQAEMNLTRSDVGLDPAAVKELATSLAAQGLQTPILVQRQKGEFAPFRMAAGYTRLAAAKSLGWEFIDVRIEASGTDRARILCNVSENMNSRKEPTALGAAHGVEALMGEGYSVAEVASILGQAEDYIRDLGRIAKGAEEVREALKLGSDHEQGVTWGVARLVLRFSKTEQAALLRKVQKLSVVKAREVLAEYRTGKKAGSDGADDETEGEGSEKGAKGSSVHDVVIPEGKVVKATVAYHGTYGTILAGLREVLSNPDTTEAVKQADKIANIMAKTLAKQEKALRDLLGDKVFEAAEKAAAKAAKEA